MVAVDSRTETSTLASPVRHDEPPPGPPRPPRGHGFEAFVAVLTVVVVVLGLYAFGQAVDEPDDGSGVAATGGDGDASATDPVDAEPVDDKGLSLLTNGHQHDDSVVELDPATQAELDRQLELTRRVAERYPTVADAEAAGYRRAGPFSPGLGAHYVITNEYALNGDGVVDDTDIDNPLSIIYDGTEPDSPIAGFMYYSLSAEEPEGFAGPNDHWHFHTNICIVQGPNGEIDAPLGADTEVSQSECDQLGGLLIPQTTWMVHVWTVPGYESDRGVFSEINPAITCSDGTYYMVPREEWVNNLLNVCRADAA